MDEDQLEDLYCWSDNQYGGAVNEQDRSTSTTFSDHVGDQRVKGTDGRVTGFL